jgi:hypothetical protein
MFRNVGHIIQTPEKPPKENTLNTEHGESLKSRINMDLQEVRCEGMD